MPYITTRGHTTVEGLELVVTETPTTAQLQEWWEAMQGDDLRVAYADSFPATLEQFLEQVRQGEKMLCFCLVNQQVAGALWLHDLLHRQDGSVAAAWIGGYFLEGYRGRTVVDLWGVIRQHWEALGIEHFFSAVHAANRRSQAMMSRGGRFHRVGKYPDFTMFHGQPVDVIIYAMHAADLPLAWELAAERAARQMLSVSV